MELSTEQVRAKYNQIYAGLSERGFGPLDGSEASMGGCHTPDKKHYILLTDGLLIYSTIPYYTDKRTWPDCADAVVEIWDGEEFEFDKLDAAMNPQQKLHPTYVRMEDLNTLLGDFVDMVAGKISLTETQQDKLFEKVAKPLEEFFNYPDYRKHL